ncbi:MAG TPA: recombinase family protein [Armatimonadota bacterium]
MTRKTKPTPVGDLSLPAKAVLYARVSSMEQMREGYSIDAQLKLLREYAEKHAFTIAEEFIDIETAKRAGRTKFGEMVAFMKRSVRSKSEVDRCRVILVEKTDRLYRNFADLVALDVDELDLEVHLVKEGGILSRDSRSHEKFIHGIKVLMAKNYIDNLSEETRKGMLEKARQGIYPSQAPIGYVNVECDGRRFIQLDPERAALVRKLFEQYATGNYSLLEVKRLADAAGLCSRKTRAKMTKNGVHSIFENPIYYGDFLWDGKLYRGSHEPIVSRDLWDQVQRVLSGKGNGCSHYNKHAWAFQGLLTCGHCGCVLTAERKKGKYIYYHCTGGRGKCPEKYIREEELARQFGLALQAIQIDERVLAWLVSALKASFQDEKIFHQQAISRLQSEATRYQQRIDVMYEDRLDGRIPAEMFERKHLEFDERLREIEREILKHRNANFAYIEEGAKLLELAHRGVELYEQRPLAEKRQILQAVLSNSTFSDGKLHPVYRKPFDMLILPQSRHQKVKAAGVSSDLLEIWQPLGDSNP